MGRRSRGVGERREYRLSRVEILGHLRERLEFLASACAGFDEQRFIEAKRIALDLRVLLHDTGTSTSILQQLDVKGVMRFEDSCGPLSPRMVVTSGALAIPAPHPGWRDDWIPLYERRAPAPAGFVDRSPKDFQRWWTETVLKDQADRRYSRKRLVLWLSDQDGGAHVDPGLDDDYAELSRRNSVGMQWTTSLHPAAPGWDFGSPVPASVRQIAHEVVRSCQWWLGDALSAVGVDDEAVAQVLAPLEGYDTQYDPSNWPPEFRERPPEPGCSEPAS